MNAYILGAKRTPIGSFQGALAEFTAPNLGAHALRSAIDHASIEPSAVDEVLMGCVVSAGVRQGPARQAMRQAGLNDRIPSATINKVCGSGMKTIMIATDQIKLGTCDVVAAGGMESMTNCPYILPKARAGLRMGHDKVLDTMFTDGLEDAESGSSMGAFAQETADQHQLTRESMDEFAIASVKHALDAMESGKLEPEVSPIDGVFEDEQPRKSKIDRIPTLRPAFAKNGTITAANASSISDGGSAVIIGNEKAAQNSKKAPMARIVAHASAGIRPSQFTLAPIQAIEKVLQRAGWDKKDVDLYEINEAFAMVTMLAIQQLQLDPSKVNIYGGACAQGHPIGSTGSRLVVTLAHALHNENLSRGVASLCIGGGEATAVAIERI